MRWLSVYALLLQVALSVSIAAQTSATVPEPDATPAPPATFKVNAHLAVADVVVTDRHGVLIHGLTATNFHVFEDGQEQTIASFEVHTGSAGAPQAPTINSSLAPDTYTNATYTKRDDPLFVILLDSLNTVMSDQSYAQSELLRLVQGLPKGSRVAVFRLGSHLSMIQGFTEDAAELAVNIKRNASPQLGMFFNDPNLNVALNAPDLTAGMGGSIGGGNSNVPTLQDANEAGIQSDIVVGRTIQALRALGLYLSGFAGRKNLVWLSGSFPIDILPNTGDTPTVGSGIVGSDLFVSDRSYSVAIHELAVLLQSANIAVYPVDVRGLVDNGLFNAAGSSAGRASANAQSVGQTLSRFANTNGQIHEVMQTIAKETGGRAYWNTNDLKGSMAEAFNDGSNYYSLSYVPKNPHLDGKFRKIRVQVDIPDAKLYYREGYYAEEPGKLKHSFPSPDPSMYSAMLRGSPAVSDITFRVHLKPDAKPHIADSSEPALKARDDKPASKLKGPVLHYAVDYTIRPAEVQFSTPQANVHRSNLAFSIIAYNADGTMLNSSVGAFNMPLNDRVYAAVQRDALHITGGIDLPPGRVYLRVGVHDLTSDKVGSFEIPLDVDIKTLK
jgi:VWFA-related protein